MYASLVTTFFFSNLSVFFSNLNKILVDRRPVVESRVTPAECETIANNLARMYIGKYSI